MGTYDGEHARSKAKPKKLEEGPGWFREPFSEIDGRKCLNGTGPVPAKVLFVDKVPDEREVWTRKPYSGRTGQFLFECLKKAGWSKEQIRACRFTYATHHAPKKYTAAEVNWGKRMFREELYETGAEIEECDFNFTGARFANDTEIEDFVKILGEHGYVWDPETNAVSKRQPKDEHLKSEPTELEPAVLDSEEADRLYEEYKKYYEEENPNVPEEVRDYLTAAYKVALEDLIDTYKGKTLIIGE